MIKTFRRFQKKNDLQAGFRKRENMNNNLRLRDSVARRYCETVFMQILFLLVCFGLSPTLRAVTPTPDGGYPGGNTAEGGSGALFSLTTGSNNTALGSQALF